ncbi:Zinc-type alcohol dehydrogenase-like protein [Falsiruegeria litorea R37]|uniref:Zinc-type alcohol dehydrogenase-like protein n=1 Tax=Falsiruegeria litorea R37 TaxID=1200284 RepID=A0A1Y5TTS6_9RHOB|nr:zinc-binding alcohol dehydrogenase family protein [Falsiruegeria litorea]SLN71980.1 Zinc-type alcohol dehydrogenase-like protein [Falsiruegeria litorea R37]
MKAVGFLNSLPIEADDSLLDVDLSTPELRPKDLLVAVEAVSINPADAKRRIRTAVDQPHPEPFVLGYDAVGLVEAVGPDVTGFKQGDRVWYAGDVNRPGSYAELQAVDHRLVSHAPQSVDAAAAASMPLVSLTAWEMLFDRLQVRSEASGETLLIIGGAGGVGSVTAQLARKLTGLEVIATASRSETEAWCRDMGAHHVVNHRDLIAQTRATGTEFVDYIVQYADTAQHWDAMCELIAPQGRIGTIVETDQKLDISALQGKSAALMWELMFTRSLFSTADMACQGQILARMARLIDDGVIRTTQTRVLGGLSAQTLKTAHEIIETGAMVGKLVVDYRG